MVAMFNLELRIRVVVPLIIPNTVLIRQKGSVRACFAEANVNRVEIK